MRNLRMVLPLVLLALVAAGCSGDSEPEPSVEVSVSEPLPDAAGVDEPTEDPEPEPEPETGPGETLDDPIPAGEPADLVDWEVTVEGVTLNATGAVTGENQFNDKPGKGEQYVMVTIGATRTASGSEDPYFDLTLSVIDSDGTQYEEAGQVIPKSLSDTGNVPNGVKGTGNASFIVPSNRARGLTLYIEAYEAEVGRFLSLG